MKTLTIKDISGIETLDGKAMRAVHGGMFRLPVYAWGPSMSVSKKDLTFKAEQLISQTQVVDNMNGNNAAFAHGIVSNVNPSQSAHNTIRF